MKLLSRFFLLVLLLAPAQSAYAAAITLVNHGFEQGLAGWVTTGQVEAVGPSTIETFNDIFWDVSPSGSQMGYLNSAAEPSNTLDAFFGLPGNTLQSMNMPGTFNDPNAGGSLTNGSGIYQDFEGNAGDTVTMFFDYVARDYVPFNDPSFGVLVSPSGFQVQHLATIYGGGIEVGTAGNSGWRSVSFTLPETGTHRLGFAVSNDRDTVLDAALFLDSSAGGSTTDDSGDLVPGESPLFPVLPDSSPFPNVFWFNDPTPALWYDPPFAEAYTYTLEGGGQFSEFSTPDAGFGFGDLLFTDLSGANASFVAVAGTLYNLLPTDSFKLSGVPNGAIDFQSPGFTSAFPAFLDWDGPVNLLEIEVTPYAVEDDDVPPVPEPSTYAMMSLGLGALYLVRRRRAAAAKN